MSDTPKRRRPFTRKNEIIGGGFFVFRRGKKTGRIGRTKFPYEHGSFASAMAEATRLAALCPGEKFEVFQTSGAVARCATATGEPAHASTPEAA